MAQKDGKRSVWLNFEVSTRVHSLTIQYDPNYGSIWSTDMLATEFTRGYFDSDFTRGYFNSSTAGEYFRKTKQKNPIFPLEFSDVTFSDSTVTFNFPKNLQETKALLVKEGETEWARNYISLKVYFTDYEPSATVRPKMSQPGKFL